MFDTEFESFYKHVKDPSWPEISEYREFVKLPLAIKNECRNMHNLDSRLDEICDGNYWISNDLWVCSSNRLAYVPVPKCACTYYLNKFTDLGWNLVRLRDLDLSGMHLFGFLMHPMNRYLKGLTEFLVRSYSEPKPDDVLPWLHELDTNWDDLHQALQSPYFMQMISNITVGDNHSTPYHAMFGDLMSRVHWIPMELFDDDQLKQQVVDFGRQTGYEIDLPRQDNRMHQSSTQQLKIYHSIKTLFFDKRKTYQFYKIFGQDLRFYYRLLDKFSS